MFSKKSEEPTTRLRELSSSDFTIAKGEPDIRGWDVRDAAGRKFGSVGDLIFDIRTGKVRYLVLNILDTRELELEKRTVLVPIGLAELDPTDNDVVLPAVNPFQLRALPRYDRNNLGAKAERDISTVFGRQATEGVPDDQFYNHDHFNQNNLYKKRRHGLSGGQPLIGGTHSHPHSEGEANTHRIIPPHADKPLTNPDNLPPAKETDEAYFRRTGKRRNNL